CPLLLLLQVLLTRLHQHFFFFSSRRRHTRSKRDWSSDVCSSDLSTLPFAPAWAIEPKTPQTVMSPVALISDPGWQSPIITTLPRSEERRVGKESRSWRWPQQCTTTRYVTTGRK